MLCVVYGLYLTLLLTLRECTVDCFELYYLLLMMEWKASKATWIWPEAVKRRQSTTNKQEARFPFPVFLIPNHL